MAHPNEDLVHRGYEAFNSADVETLRQLFADTTIFHEPGRSSISGDYQGLDQVLGFFGTLAERSGGTFRATLHDVVANDEHAIGLHSSDAERDGRRISSPTVLVFHVRMEGSPRPGRTTTTSMNSTSSGRRSASRPQSGAGSGHGSGLADS